MTLSVNEREELEMLRASAARFMTDPLERAAFDLENVLDRQQVGPIIQLIIKVVLLLKQEIRK